MAFYGDQALRRKAEVETIRILLIESERSSTGRIEGLLIPSRGSASRSFYITRIESIDEAHDLLDRKRAFDVVLLDDDAMEPSASPMFQTIAERFPVVVLSDADDDSQGVEVIGQGAQDWISKQELSEANLLRSIRHAVARKQIDVELRCELERLETAQSETQRQASELHARAKELDELNRELDDFIYAASHDLKEPVRGIRAYCELFAEDLKGCLDDDGEDRIRAIMAMCGRLETQIGDLLTFYRVGQIRPAVTQVDLSEVVDGQVESFQPLLDRRKGVIRVKGPLPIVQGHPVLLGMVFGNLISNGLKYNRAKRPVVEIGMVDDRPGTLYVRDNGIGIAPEHHENIFDLFRRLHGRKEFEGTGAGLTIVRKIIRSYGGEISIESELGRGCTFFFSLPWTVAEPPRPPHWLANSGEIFHDQTADSQHVM